MNPDILDKLTTAILDGNEPEPVQVTALALPEVYYDGSRFHLPKPSGGWVSADHRSARAYLVHVGFSSERSKEERQSVVDALVVRIQTEHHVIYVGPLAGYPAGLREMNGALILVTNSPKFIEAKAGPFPMLHGLLDNLLGAEQLLYFYSWLKIALDTFVSGMWQPAQVLALFGPPGAGKNLLRRIITAILGGRVARPQNFMSGRTAFNLDVLGAETLALEDEQGSTDIRARRDFAQRIKDFAVNQDQRCEAKHCDALILQPLWRLIISGNDDPERLLVLPPLDADVADKIMLFKVAKHPMPMPTATPHEKAIFWSAITAELPMFVNFLETWDIPPDLRCDRYGVMHYHNPDLAEQLAHTAPEASLIEMIDAELFRHENAVWIGSAIQLESKLCDQGSQCVAQARKILTGAQTCGRYLARLEKLLPDRVRRKTSKGKTIWTIQRPERAQEPERVSPLDARIKTLVAGANRNTE
jgi:hypothetical protein